MYQFLRNAGKPVGQAVNYLKGAFKSKAPNASSVASGLVDQYGNPISSVAKSSPTTFGDIGQFFKNNALSGFDALRTGIQTLGNTPVKAAAGPAALLAGLGIASSAIYDKNMENAAHMSKEYEPEFWNDWGEYSRREMSKGAEQDDLMPIEDFRKQWIANKDNQLNQDILHNMYEEDNVANVLPTPVTPTPEAVSTPALKAKPEVATKKVAKPVLRADGTPAAPVPNEVIPGPDFNKTNNNNGLNWFNQLLPLLLAGGVGYYAGK